jgi:hypothetical protein
MEKDERPILYGVQRANEIQKFYFGLTEYQALCIAVQMDAIEKMEENTKALQGIQETIVNLDISLEGNVDEICKVLHGINNVTEGI